MSIEALNWAFKQKVKPSSLKFVLVALCDYASEGGEAFPSIETLSNKTSQDRKTVMKNLEKLRDLNVIFDTGHRRGSTNQVVVYKVIFTGDLAEKQNSTKNGTVPFLTPNSTKNGTGKESQKRYTEPSVNNHQLEPSDINVEVVNFWMETMKARPKEKRQKDLAKIVKSRLKDYSVDDLKDAITGCSKSKFHMGDNEHRKKYNSLELILRNSEKIEGFIEIAKQPEINQEVGSHDSRDEYAKELGLDRSASRL